MCCHINAQLFSCSPASVNSAQLGIFFLSKANLGNNFYIII